MLTCVSRHLIHYHLLPERHVFLCAPFLPIPIHSLWHTLQAHAEEANLNDYYCMQNCFVALFSSTALSNVCKVCVQIVVNHDLILHWSIGPVSICMLVNTIHAAKQPVHNLGSKMSHSGVFHS